MMNPINTAVVQTTEAKAAKILPFQSPPGRGTATGESGSREVQPSIEEERIAQEQRQAQERTPLEERKEQEEEISQEMLDDLSTDIEILHSVGLNFAQHEDTGRTMVKVINRDTDELIREIPPKKVLDMAAKMEEMIGILFDEKV